MFRLADSEELDRSALVCAAAGAACVAVSLVTPASATEWFRWTGPAALAAAGAGGLLPQRLRGALFGAAAAIGCLVWRGYPVFADLVAGALVGAALVWGAWAQRGQAAEKPSWTKRALALGFAAVAWPLAVRGMHSVELASLAQSVVPPSAIQSASGGLFGLLMGLTPTPLYLEPQGDPVTQSLARARPMLDGELRELVLRIVDARGRALKLLERSRAEGSARTETRRGLDGVALTAVELTDRFGAVDRVLSRTPLQSVEERSRTLRAQLDATQDPGVKRDLERALQALDEQRLQIERLLQGRARLVARLESELAALEKTEMSLALLASGDAAIAGLKLESISSSLSRQAHEFEAEGSALQEAITVAPTQALRRMAEAMPLPEAPRPAPTKVES